MARRSGKADRRRNRQKATRREAARRDAPAPAIATPVPPVGTPDAREAVALDPPKRVPPPVGSGPSALTERARAEYHYVFRDLRDIGILSAIMAALLLVAWMAFTATGLVAT